MKTFIAKNTTLIEVGAKGIKGQNSIQDTGCFSLLRS